MLGRWTQVCGLIWLVGCSSSPPASDKGPATDALQVEDGGLDGAPQACQPEDVAATTLGSHAVIWRYLVASKVHLSTVAELTRDLTVPLDVGLGFVAAWESFTEDDKTTLHRGKIDKAKSDYEGVVSRVTTDLSVGRLSETLVVLPCHNVGTRGGNTDDPQSACHISAIEPDHHDDWLEFLKATTLAYLDARHGSGDFLVAFGGAEIPREIWFDADTPEDSFMRDPAGFVELAREVWETVRLNAAGHEVSLRLPGFMTPHLMYMQYEDSGADQIQLIYSDGKRDVVLSRSTIDQVLVQLFKRALNTSQLNATQAAQLAQVDCFQVALPKDDSYPERRALCDLVQKTSWVREVIAQIPSVLGRAPPVPLVVDLHLYGGSHQQQLHLADPQSVIRKVLGQYPQVSYIVVEQGSPYSALATEDMLDPEAVYLDLARDLPKSALTLLTAGISTIPTRPPITEIDAWPNFDLYGLIDEAGNKRAAYYATQELLELLAGRTEGAILTHRRLRGVEIMEFRPADERAPTFVMWASQETALELSNPQSKGMTITVGPTSPDSAKGSVVCQGEPTCSVTVGETPVYLNGPDVLRITGVNGSGC